MNKHLMVTLLPLPLVISQILVIARLSDVKYAFEVESVHIFLAGMVALLTLVVAMILIVHAVMEKNNITGRLRVLHIIMTVVLLWPLWLILILWVYSLVKEFIS